MFKRMTTLLLLVFSGCAYRTEVQPVGADAGVEASALPRIIEGSSDASVELPSVSWTLASAVPCNAFGLCTDTSTTCVANLCVVHGDPCFLGSCANPSSNVCINNYCIPIGNIPPPMMEAGVDAPADTKSDVDAGKPQCATVADCSPHECFTTACTAGACGYALQPDGTLCANNHMQCTSGSCACPSKPGTQVMVDTGTVCIDKQEVSRQEYALFLASNPTPDGVLVPSTHTDFMPGNMSWPGDANDAILPVANVDWWDGAAYCKWAGKRLCGKVGGGALHYGAYVDALDAGPGGPDDWKDPTQSQWMAACTSGGVYTYPYGNTYSAQTCLGVDSTNNVSAWRASVTQLTSCRTPAGVYNMSGSLDEWENDCLDNFHCHLRGGTYATQRTDLRCDGGEWDGKGRQEFNIGFRCCGP